MKMLKCSRFKMLFSAYLDGEVKERVRAAIEEHLARCPECREEMRMFKVDQELLSSVKAEGISPYFTVRTMARIRALKDEKVRRWTVVKVAWQAGALLLVLLGVGLGILLGSNLAQNNRLRQEVATLNAEPSIEELFLANAGGE
ncbi:MAG: anti-sigma factor family protein [bacterium]